MNKNTITFSNLSPEERAGLIRAALDTQEQAPVLPKKAPAPPQNITQESVSREQWIYIFQHALAEDELDLEQQAEIARAAFNRHEDTKQRHGELQIVNRLVKNLGVSDDVSLTDEISKAIKLAEDQGHYELLRKLIAVYVELERLAGKK